METNINLAQKSYVDYIGSLYMNACEVKNVNFSLKVIETKAGETLPLIHVEGVQLSTGVIVNFDLFPRDNATAEDLEALKDIKEVSDITFRVGYYPSIDKDGNERLAAGSPKWLSLTVGGKKFMLSGGKREYQA